MGLVFLGVWRFGWCFYGCLILGAFGWVVCVWGLLVCAFVWLCGIVCRCGLEFWDRCFVRGVVVVLPVGC